MTASTILLANQGALVGNRLSAAEATPPDFGRQVAPLFRKYCVGCHNADDAEGGLTLGSYETLLAGGDGGAVLIPGKSDASRLIQLLTGQAEPAMPPEGNEAPTADEIVLLKAWINGGAKGPLGMEPDPKLLVTPRVAPRVRVAQSIHSAQFSPDGKQVALGSFRTVRLLSAESRAVVATWEGHTGRVTALALSADGNQLLAAGGEPGLSGEVVFWDRSAGTPLRTMKGHDDCLYAVAVSPDGKVLATAGYDQRIKLWDLTTGQEILTIAGHTDAVYDLAFTPDGRLLASASADSTIKLWEVATGERVDTFSQPTKQQNTVAISPDGRHVAAGGGDNRIRIWELSETAQEDTNELIVARFAHQGSILRVRYSPDGKTLVSAADDGSVTLWDANPLKPRRQLPIQSDWTTAMSISPDSGTLFLGRHDGSYEFYSTSNGRIQPPASPELIAVAPRSIQRGVTTRVHLRGTNLLSATRSLFDHKGISATILPQEKENPNELWLEVTPASNVPRGTYKVGISTRGGSSKRLPLAVDDIAQVAEKEPNNRLSEATPATQLPSGLVGVISTAGDEDYFRFEASAGSTVVFDLQARREGSKLDGVLTLFDSQGRLLATNHHFNAQDDPLLVYEVETAGQYTIRVSDLRQDGGDDRYYSLAVGALPVVTGWFPLSVPAETESEVALLGYNLPEGATVKVPARKSGEFALPIDTQRYRMRATPKVVIGSWTEVVEVEPNDTPQQAMPLPVPGTASGRIFRTETSTDSAAVDTDRGVDVDLYRFEAKAGESLIVETDAARRGSPIDTKIEVLDSQGQPLERALLEAVRDSYITFRPINSDQAEARLTNWEEMQLDQYLYMQGEVVKLFRAPRGPDSGFSFYTRGGKRIGYFDTSGTAHAIDESCYIVRPHPSGTKLASTGLPVFPVYYTNDDDGQRMLGNDSRLYFTAPEDGAYLVRVTDVSDSQGQRFAYRLTIRAPRPDFQVSLGGGGSTVHAGGAKNITFDANRIDDFDGMIRVDVTGLPEGFSMTSPVEIPAGHLSATAALVAEDGAASHSKEVWTGVKISATAQIGDSEVTHPVNNLGTVNVTPPDNVLVVLEPAEVSLAPGGVTTAMLKIQRVGDFKGRVRLEVNNLPHGVIVDNIGLSGVLIPEGQTERQIFLRAEGWVPETTRAAHAVTAEPGGEASPAITVHVRRADSVAQAGASQNAQPNQGTAENQGAARTATTDTTE
jgi:WD40 repeat protein